MKHTWSKALALLVVCVGSAVFADPVWTTGVHDYSVWTQNPSNLLAAATRSGGIAAMDNGVMDQPYNNGNFSCSSDDPGVTVTWTLGLAASVTDVKVWMCYKDGGRDGICILNIDVLKEGATEWETLPNSAIEYATYRKDGNNNSKGSGKFLSNIYGFFRNADGSPLATNVAKIRIHFGQQDNNTSGLGEIEVIGFYPPTRAVIKSVTTANHVFDTLWTTMLSSLGASDSATVNLLASSDNKTWLKVATGTIAATETPLTLTNTLATVGASVYGAIEVINTDGVTTWCSTNFPGKVTVVDNAIYYWKRGTSGTWETQANWSNSFTNDTRLTYPSVQTATASFRECATGGPVTVTVGSDKNLIVEPLPDTATVTFKGAKSSVQLIHRNNANGSGSRCSGTNIYDGIKFKYESGVKTRRKAVLRLQNGAQNVSNGENDINGVDSRVEVGAGCTYYQNRGGIGGNAEIVISNGTCQCNSTFVKSHLNGVSAADGNATNGTVVLQGTNPRFNDPNGHYLMQYGMKTPFTIRFEFPKAGWADAVYRFGNGHGDTRDGFGGGQAWWRVEVADFGDLAEAHRLMRPTRAMDVHLVESLVNGLQMITNNIEFAAFGVEKCWPGKKINRKGDYFYFTYDNSTVREPATPGACPTGLWYHYNGRSYGSLIMIR